MEKFVLLNHTLVDGGQRKVTGPHFIFDPLPSKTQTRPPFQKMAPKGRKTLTIYSSFLRFPQRLQKIFVSAGTTAWLGTTGTTAGSVTTNFSARNQLRIFLTMVAKE